uniref:WW domain-containing protein n=1 Tax=Panagrolaimus sp. PS1159 TaxID=55785 RepID=A0AC35F2M8_9BILA
LRSSIGYAKFLNNAIKNDYRYRGDQHHESRRYEDRRHDGHRDRDDHHYDSRHRNHRHDHHHHSDRHSYFRQRSSKSRGRRNNYSISPIRRSSPHNSEKESPVQEHRSKSSMAKTIKIEIPETSSVIKSESPPEISPVLLDTVPSFSTPTPSLLTKARVVSSKSNMDIVSFEDVFPEAVSLSRPIKIPTVRLPIVVPPFPPQFFPQSSLSNQQWFGYPTTYYPVPPPPPPPSNILQQISNQSAFSQPIQISLPAEPTVPDPQPSYEISKQSVRDYYESSVVSLSKEIKREVVSPAVSDPIQSQPTPEEAQNDEEEEVEKSKLKLYEKNPDWIETYTDDGIIYYYHKETRETSWEEPPPKAPEKIAPKPVFQQSEGLKRPEKRPESVQIDVVKLKKQFKLKIWQNIHKYLKPRNEMKTVDEGTLTQFARKMTHQCLDVELKNGNKNFEITEKMTRKCLEVELQNENKNLEITENVYLRARQITDQNYVQFVTETRTIKAEPLH